MKGTLHSPKLQYYWSLTIRLFRLIFRTFVMAVGVLHPLQRSSRCILQPQPTGQCLCVYVCVCVCVCVCCHIKLYMYYSMFIYAKSFLFFSLSNFFCRVGVQPEFSNKIFFRLAQHISLFSLFYFFIFYFIFFWLPSPPFLHVFGSKLNNNIFFRLSGLYSVNMIFLSWK